MHVAHFWRVIRGLVERQRLELIVRNRDTKAVPEILDRILIELLLLVGCILAFANPAHPVSLDGLR